MKRILRDPEKFEVIDLYTALGRDKGYRLGVEADEIDFMKRVQNSLKASNANNNLLHGKRIESLFAHVAGALGNCQLIKKEDSGEIFSTESGLQAPDYKVILKDGSQYFIEVKNCHSPKPTSLYPFEKKYVKRLESYAGLHDTPLLFAVYYSRFRKWVLLRKESLIEQKKRYAIDFLGAWGKSEMSILGDRMIGTEPPLSIELLADKSKKIDVQEDGQVNFFIDAIKFYTANRAINEDKEKAIAFYLMRFGTWDELESVAMFDDDGDFTGARFTVAPDERREDGFLPIIGEMSSMISSAYTEKTVYEKSVIALDTNLDPSVFSVEIPHDYKGVDLKLMRLTIQANSNF